MGAQWPIGVQSAVTSSGIKPGGQLDLGVLVFSRPLEWSGIFTRNAAAAAPVRWCRHLAERGNPVRAVVVNSGNANSCTGETGNAAVRAIASTMATHIGCDTTEVLVCSTGVIGKPLPADRIVDAVPSLLSHLGTDATPFSKAILTSDSRTKTAAAHNPHAHVFGVAKGGAMLAPNLATMLAFVAVDGRVSREGLHVALRQAADVTFNQILIDGCESTNDSVLVFATGRGVTLGADEVSEPLTTVCRSLAKQIAGDTEGATRMVSITVKGGRTLEDASRVARGVASSTLFRAALHGAYPAWGRVLAAIGSVDRGLDMVDVSITVGDTPLVTSGKVTDDLAAVRAVMRRDSYELVCTIGSGPYQATVWTADLSPAYVSMNAGETTYAVDVG